MMKTLTTGADVTERIPLTINGVSALHPGGTLADLLAALGHSPKGVATAVNGEFVAAGLRASRRLVAGDQIEIVAPRQGG